MDKIYYLARTPTIEEIANAIEQANNESLPTLYPPDNDICFIYRSTLEAIAEYIRSKEGTTALIPVTELAERLLALCGQSDGTTTAILGRAILGKAILGRTVSLPKLSAPTIWLEGAADVPKLDTPVIRLEDVVEAVKLATPTIRLYEEGSGDGSTTAILGQAILGKAILGKAIPGGDVDQPKLDAPVIRLVDMGETIKLDAPVIRLEEIAEIVKLAAPTIRLEEVAEIIKLAAPTIRLEEVATEEPDVPDIPKLATPSIRIEVIEDVVPDEPDVPTIEKLDAPTIRIEVIEDEEPDEPDIPVVPKLDAPVISLVEVSDVIEPAAGSKENPHQVSGEAAPPYIIKVPANSTVYYKYNLMFYNGYTIYAYDVTGIEVDGVVYTDTNEAGEIVAQLQMTSLQSGLVGFINGTDKDVYPTLRHEVPSGTFDNPFELVVGNNTINTGGALEYVTAFKPNFNGDITIKSDVGEDFVLILDGGAFSMVEPPIVNGKIEYRVAVEANTTYTLYIYSAGTATNIGVTITQEDTGVYNIPASNWLNDLKLTVDFEEYEQDDVYHGVINDDGLCEWDLPAYLATGYDNYIRSLPLGVSIPAQDSITMDVGITNGFFGGSGTAGMNYIAYHSWSLHDANGAQLGVSEITRFEVDGNKSYTWSARTVTIPVTTPGNVTEIRLNLRIHHPEAGTLSMNAPDITITI